MGSAITTSARPNVVSRLEELFEVSRDQHTTIPALAGLRGVAVILVFLTHYVSHLGPWLTGDVMSAFAARVADVGHMGVDLFFVLSGYLIYGSLLRTRQPLTTFFARRAIRIYPAFIFVLGLYLVLAVAFPEEHKLPGSLSAAPLYILENALLLPGMFAITPLITVAWSLSYEAFYYVVAPAVVYGCRFPQLTRAARMTCLSVMSILAFLAAARWAPDHVRLLMFPAGMLLFEIGSDGTAEGRQPVGVAAFVIAALAIGAVPHLAAPNRSVILSVTLSLLCLDALHWRTLTAKWLSCAPLRWLGNMSYSYYLMHGLTIKICFLLLRNFHVELTPIAVWSWILLPAVWAVTLVPSACLFAFIEKPFSFPARVVRSHGIDGLRSVANLAEMPDQRLKPRISIG